MIITIDGATGVGKSTVARKVAEELGFFYVSTGRIYRSLAYCLMNNERKNILFIIDNLKLEFINSVLIANAIEDESILQSEDIAFLAAEIGANSDYKKAISNKIIFAIAARNVVVEGRKAGTILFPNATLKVYLRANLDARISRKMHQLSDSTYDFVKNVMSKRDDLVNSIQADNSFEIDTSQMSTQDVVNEILIMYKTLIEIQ